MTYQVLARKWRPQKFAEIVGQQHVTQGIVHSLSNQSLHHAYLFTGTRGVGKTTLARIVAKALNCEKGVSSEPCGHCESCKDIANSRFPDVFEIDAASRTKVEDTRELLENVQYAPSIGRYKIYLIDEVHMLSTHSFNALLKTLEEPPEHVKFLLATTDPQKLPITVLSRCLQFNLKPLSKEQITKHLAYILQQEKVKFDDKVIMQLAKAAKGSMRDALSLLDQSIAAGKGELDLSIVQGMLGMVDQHNIYDILLAVADKNAKQLVTISLQMLEQGCDFVYFCSELARAIFELATSKMIDDFSPDILTEEQLHKLREFFASEQLQLYYEIIVKGQHDLSLAPDVKLGFDMLLLRMLAFAPHTDQNKLRKKNSNSTTTSENHSPKKQEPVVAINKPKVSSSEFLQQVPLTGVAKQLAMNCQLMEVTDSFVILELGVKHKSMLNDRLQAQLQQAISDFMGKNIRLKIQIGKTVTRSPAKKQQADLEKEKDIAKDSIAMDKNISFIKDQFNAIIEAESINPIKSEEKHGLR